MELSIIIVNYNTKELTKQTIDSVLNTVRNIEYEILLVDNASVDGSQAFFKQELRMHENIKITNSKLNLGFAKGNNLVMKNAKGNYVLLLNSDTVVKENCIEACLNYLKEDDEIGAIGPKILLKSGKLDHACKRGFPTPGASLYYMLGLDKKHPENKKYGQYRMTYIDDNEVGEVDALTGAFMMVKKSVIDDIGMLDERFFMFAEDIDWCYRIKEAGLKVIYYPKVETLHLKGESSKKKRRFRTIFAFYKTMVQFYNKHYIKKYNFIVTIIVYTGIGMKLMLSILRNAVKRNSGGY